MKRFCLVSILAAGMGFVACGGNGSVQKLLGLNSQELKEKKDLESFDLMNYSSVDKATGRRKVKVTILTRTFANGLVEQQGQKFVDKFPAERLAELEYGTIEMKELRDYLLGRTPGQEKPFFQNAEESVVEQGVWPKSYYYLATNPPTTPTRHEDAGEPTAQASGDLPGSSTPPGGQTGQTNQVKYDQYTVTYPYAHYRVVAREQKYANIAEPIDWEIDIYVNDAYLYRPQSDFSKNSRLSNIVIFNGLATTTLGYYTYTQPTAEEQALVPARQLIVANRCGTELEETQIVAMFKNAKKKVDLISNRTYTYIKKFSYVNSTFFGNLVSSKEWPVIIDSFRVDWGKIIAKFKAEGRQVPNEEQKSKLRTTEPVLVQIGEDADLSSWQVGGPKGMQPLGPQQTEEALPY